MQPDALGLLGVGVGGLSVHLPQSETCKACVSSWPSPNPSGCTCLCHLTPPGALGGITSQIFPFKLLPAPSSPLQSSAGRLFSRASKSPPGSQTSGDCKAPQLRAPPPISTREPPHPAPGRASPRRAETRSWSAPEPLATPSLRLPRTEPGPGRAGPRERMGRPARGGGALSPDRKCTQTLRILNQPVNSRRLGPSVPSLDTPSEAPLLPRRPLT